MACLRNTGLAAMAVWLGAFIAVSDSMCNSGNCPDLGWCSFDLIIRGKAISETEDYPGRRRYYTVEVLHRYKMPPRLMGNQTLTMRTHIAHSACGESFILNKKTYLIKAILDDMGMPVIKSCDHNQQWEHVEKEEKDVLTTLTC